MHDLVQPRCEKAFLWNIRRHRSRLGHGEILPGEHAESQRNDHIRLQLRQRPLPLHGLSRHQDQAVGSAAAVLREDIPGAQGRNQSNEDVAR